LTKVTGSMRGMEEREFLFGKLFGYLSLIRSGKLKEGRSFVSDIINVFLSLYQAKPWIQEVTIESLLTLFINIIDDTQISKYLEHSISTLLPNHPYSVGDLSPNEILIIAAMQWLYDYYLPVLSISSIRTPIPYPSILPDDRIISSDSLRKLSHIYVSACTGYPKVSDKYVIFV